MVLAGGKSQSQWKEGNWEKQGEFSWVSFCFANVCLDGFIRVNPVAPASGPLANILLFECDSSRIRVTAGRTQSVTQSTTRCTAAAHMTLWFVFTMTLAT